LIESNYLLRYLSYALKSGFKQSVQDYKLFEKNKISSSDSPFHFGNSDKRIIFPPARPLINGSSKKTSFEEMLEASQTYSFIIIKDDNILYEKYFHGYSRESLFNLFSVSKSFTSALIGLAVEDGLIKSLQDPVTKYLPELKKNGLERISINNLLQMHSGIKFIEGLQPWKELVKGYLHPDVKELLNTISVEDEIGKYFHYNDFHLLLLSLILKRVLNCSITEYFEKRIWKKIGAEFPAYMCVDNSKDRIEKLESGFVTTPIDLAKFGRLYLNKGKFNGDIILPEKWISDSIDFQSVDHSSEYFSYYKNKSWGNWFSSNKAAYKNFWWGYKIDKDYYDYFAMGILGQILYISPRNNAIGVRVGNLWGIKGWWPSIIKEIIYNT
jgi:CubicO group peptidase (beta-lactamase class C family)